MNTANNIPKTRLKKIIEEIESNYIDGAPHTIITNDDGTITQEYSDIIVYDGISYSYDISWTGFHFVNRKNGFFEWFKPRNIQIRNIRPCQ